MKLLTIVAALAFSFVVNAQEHGAAAAPAAAPAAAAPAATEKAPAKMEKKASKKKHKKGATEEKH